MQSFVLAGADKVNNKLHISLFTRYKYFNFGPNLMGLNPPRHNFFLIPVLIYPPSKSTSTPFGTAKRIFF